MSRDLTDRFRFGALHVLALWSLGVAHPIFDILSQNPEFFVAHDARPIDLVVFVLFLCGLIPLSGLLVLRVATWLGPRVHTVATWSVMMVLFGIISLQVLARVSPTDADVAVPVAAGVGVILAVAYLRLSSLRLFTTLLTPAVIVVPVVFLLQSGVSGVLHPADVEPLDVEFERTPPVVMVVFDQLPLATLLARDGQIDAALYPHFASLGRDATWFRNASAVAGLTEVAVPALVTGVRPETRKLPILSDHPGNLFTLLGSRYRMQAVEPITRLCPETECVHEAPSSIAWFWSVVPDVSVVYLHIVLPEDLAARLPPVTQNWKDFVANDTAFERWMASRGSGRPETVSNFVDAIEPMEDGADPPLYFLHMLLPHEPWVYLPSGQRYSTQAMTSGLGTDGRWAADEMAVSRNLQRHLLQVRFSDKLLGRVLDRLREVGLFDQALIVVTADHGASFQAEFPFRSPRSTSFAEIGSVPLFVKTPGQQSGQVLDTNAEAVDVIPTIAGVLGIQLPWESDGTDVLSSQVKGRGEKRYFYTDGREPLTAPADLGQHVDEVVARKFRRFDNPDGFHQPQLGLHDDLVGRALSELDRRPSSTVAVDVDFPAIFADADPAGDFVPAHVTGAVLDLGDADVADRPVLAVTLNGVVAGITQPYEYPVSGRPHSWEVIVDPGLIVPGANDLAVYVVTTSETDDVVLELAYRADGDASLNLVLNQAGPLLGVTTSGFFDTEWMGQRPFRWTGEEAMVRVPVDPQELPTELVIEVLMTGPMRKSVVVSVNDCTLAEEEVAGAWRQTWPLEGCRIDGDVMEVRLQSDVSVASGTDSRNLGLAVGRVELR